jgi:hypothetical protein
MVLVYVFRLLMHAIVAKAATGISPRATAKTPMRPNRYRSGNRHLSPMYAILSARQIAGLRRLLRLNAWRHNDRNLSAADCRFNGCRGGKKHGLPSRWVNANRPRPVRPIISSLSRHKVSADVSDRHPREQHSDENRGKPIRTSRVHAPNLPAPVQAPPACGLELCQGDLRPVGGFSRRILFDEPFQPAPRGFHVAA